MKRKEIMTIAEFHGCPQDFIDELKSFIDDVENLAIDVHDNLEINRVEDLDRIAIAKTAAEKLVSDLY